MIDLDKEAQQARRQFFLTAGAVVCFLFLPMLFMPLFYVHQYKGGEIWILPD